MAAALTMLAACGAAAVAARPPNSADAFARRLPAGIATRLSAPDDEVARQLLADYGAMFVARGVARPPTVMFANAAACARWQASVATATATLGGVRVTLQAPALRALLAAQRDAAREGVTIQPTGADAAKRTYAQTLTLWESRVNPGLAYWVKWGRIQPDAAAKIRSMPVAEQVRAILGLEKRGIFFSQHQHKSILFSVAAPGSSQHIAMLALDLRDAANPKVRAALRRHGWFQTVLSDSPHFTYLGVGAVELPGLGLKSLKYEGRTFWIPDLAPAG